MKENRKFTHLGSALETEIKINVNAAVTQSQTDFTTVFSIFRAFP